jgi:hypothetical protein
MTIAAGFMCNEGIVLCADSQTTISGYIKNFSGKMGLIVTPSWTMVVTGAGTDDYIRAASQRLTRGLSDEKDYMVVRTQLEERLLEFFQQQMVPWAAFPLEERPSVELLVGLSMKDGPFGLFHSSGTSFTNVSDKAVGAGVLLANSLIGELTWQVTKLDKLKIIAAYIVAKVKEQVDTCGGFTSMTLLRPGGDWAIIESYEVEMLEKEMSEIDEKQTTTLKAELSRLTLNTDWFGDRKKR